MDYDANSRKFYFSRNIVVQDIPTALNECSRMIDATRFYSLATYPEGKSQSVITNDLTNLYQAEEDLTQHLAVQIPQEDNLIANLRTNIEYCLYVSTTGTFSVKLVFYNDEMDEVIASTDSMLYDPDNDSTQPSFASLNGVKFILDLMQLPKSAKYCLVQVQVESGKAATFKFDYAKAETFHTVNLDPIEPSLLKAVDNVRVDMQYYNSRGSSGDIDALTIKVNQNENDIETLDTGKLNLTGGTLTGILTSRSIYMNGYLKGPTDGMMWVQTRDTTTPKISFSSENIEDKSIVRFDLSEETGPSILLAQLGQTSPKGIISGLKDIDESATDADNTAVPFGYMKSFLYNMNWNLYTTSYDAQTELGPTQWNNLTQNLLNGTGNSSIFDIVSDDSEISLVAIGMACSGNEAIANVQVLMGTTNNPTDLVATFNCPVAPTGLFRKFKLNDGFGFKNYSTCRLNNSALANLTELKFYFA